MYQVSSWWRHYLDDDVTKPPKFRLFDQFSTMPFGGQFLFSPGDPSGRANNVINCRCSTAPFPKEVVRDNNIIGQLTTAYAISQSDQDEDNEN